MYISTINYVILRTLLQRAALMKRQNYACVSVSDVTRILLPHLGLTRSILHTDVIRDSHFRFAHQGS